MSRILLLLLSLTIAHTVPGEAPSSVPQRLPAAAAELRTVVDRTVQDIMIEESIPGAAVAIVAGGEVVLEAGYGVASVAGGVPVSAERTRFRIGSISKVLTALGLVRMLDQGAIDLDTPVSSLLPPAFAGIDRFAEPIRVRHLLTHSAGFDQIGLRRQQDETAARTSLERFLAAELRPVRPPGVVGVYDTYGITLAGHLLERVSGLSYAEYLQREVFAPLGMTRAAVETPVDDRDDLAIGYGLENGELVAQEYEWYVTLPASSVDATASDMAQLLLALLGDGSTSAGRLLSPETTARVRNERQLSYGSQMEAFAWGFWVEHRDGYRALHHGGVMSGYSSELYLVPEAGVGLFVVASRDPETGRDPRLREILVDLLYEHVLEARAPTSSDVVATAPGAADELTGVYAGTVACFSCTEERGWPLSTLRVEPREEGRIALAGGIWSPLGGDAFRNDETGQRVRFLRDDKDRIRYLVSGPRSYARLDEVTFAEVMGPDWRQSPSRLVAVAHRDAGDWGPATEAYATLARRHPDEGEYAYYEGFSALNAGDPDHALDAFRRALEAGRWPAWSRYYIASAHAALGDEVRALEALEEAVDAGFGDSGLPSSEPWWDALRDNSRFRALLEAMGA